MSYLRLQKVATLVQTLSIGLTELPVLLPAPIGQGIVDFNALPATPGVVAAPSTALFGSWQRLINTYAVRARLRGGPTALFDLIGQATATSAALPTFLASLSQVTGWSNADVTAVARLLHARPRGLPEGDGVHRAGQRLRRADPARRVRGERDHLGRARSSSPSTPRSPTTRRAPTPRRRRPTSRRPPRGSSTTPAGSPPRSR